MWLRRVDWDGIEGDPDAMDDLLAEGLQDTLDSYGEPRGVVRVSETDEQSAGGEGERPPTPEEEIAQLSSINWSELDKDGNHAHSDEDFSKVVARSIRLSRET